MYACPDFNKLIIIRHTLRYNKYIEKTILKTNLFDLLYQIYKLRIYFIAVNVELEIFSLFEKNIDQSIKVIQLEGHGYQIFTVHTKKGSKIH